MCDDPETRPEPDALADALHDDLLKHFKPAFLGRLTVIPYYPLPDNILGMICELKLKSIGRRVFESYKAEFSWQPEVVKAVIDRCNEVDSGARIIDRVLSGTMLPELSTRLLAKLAEGQIVEGVTVQWDSEKGDFEYEIHLNFFIKKDLVPQEIVHTQDNIKAAGESGGSLTLSDT